MGDPIEIPLAEVPAPIDHTHLNQLRGRNHRVMTLHCQGMSNKEIAQVMKCHTSTVSQILNSPIIKERITQLQLEIDQSTADFAKELGGLRGPAIGVYREILEDQHIEADHKLRAMVAGQVLDRTGLGRSTKVEQKTYTSDRGGLQAILESAAELGMIEEIEAIDIEPIDGLSSQQDPHQSPGGGSGSHQGEESVDTPPPLGDTFDLYGSPDDL
jgi:hypothetical protein